jgi:Glycosyl transferase family 11/Glycosyl transferase family 2
MTSLIVARLSGGLGNQLFQYGAARAVAEAAGATVVLDVSHFAASAEPRRFALGRFLPELPVVAGSRFDAAFRTAILPAQPALAQLGCAGELRLPVRRENDYEFEPATLALRGDAYLYGFWQSWRYVEPVADRLRRELVGAGASDPTAVAVHVRRGDYLDPANRACFGVCEPGYYRAAMAQLRARLAQPQFRIFSDDPAWCRDSFAAPDVVIAAAPDGDAAADLIAMARCRHHILANSSLGWWAAWLGARPDSHVIAPIPWFNEAPRAGDLLPAHWTRLHRSSGDVWPAPTRDTPTMSVVVLSREPARLAAALANAQAQSRAATEIIVARAAPARDGAALNAALAQATGDWIGFLDERDAWLPDKLAIELEAARLTGATAILCRTIPVAGPAGPPALYPPPGPPDCSLAELVRAGGFIAGISHTIARRDLLCGLGRFEDGWQVGEPSALLGRLHWHDGTLRLWQRLVRSPIGFLGHVGGRS